MEFPKIIHLIYIPWNKNQKIKDNYMDFDTRFYHSFRKNISQDWEIILWTRDKIENFMNKYYKKEWKYVKNKSSRPVMLVDYLRWKLVYHFGGLYWQYGSKLKSSLKYYIPPYKGVQLFTETETNILYRYYTSFFRIRGGSLETSLRIATQVFSSYPKNKFIKLVVDRILYNLGKYKVHEDYDILFIGGNDMISTVYDKYKSILNKTKINKYNVELYSYKKSQKLITVSSNGSWRLNNWTYYIPTIGVLFVMFLLVIILGYFLLI